MTATSGEGPKENIPFGVLEEYMGGTLAAGLFLAQRTGKTMIPSKNDDCSFRYLRSDTSINLGMEFGASVRHKLVRHCLAQKPRNTTNFACNSFPSLSICLHVCACSMLAQCLRLRALKTAYLLSREHAQRDSPSSCSTRFCCLKVDSLELIKR